MFLLLSLTLLVSVLFILIVFSVNYYKKIQELYWFAVFLSTTVGCYTFHLIVLHAHPNNSWLVYLCEILPLLCIMPLFYFFNTLLQLHFLPKFKLYLIFIPLLAGMILKLPFLDDPFQLDSHHLTMSYNILFLFKLMVFTAVLLFFIKNLNKSKESDIRLKLGRYMLLFFALISVSGLVRVILEHSEISDYIFKSSISIAFLLMLFYTFKYLPIFIHHQKNDNDYLLLEKGPSKEVPENQENKFFNISDEKAEALFKQIIGIIEEKQLYLDPEFSLVKLSEITNIKSYLISYVLNNHRNTTFYQVINEYRVHNVCALISNKRYSNYTIEALGNLAGFKNKTTFYTAFKTHIG